MRLISFRLQNFKKYKDTNWINVENLTAFVGKNEAGKSSLFKGLSKLKPADNIGYDEFRELPRRLLTELQDQNSPATSGKFVLNSIEKQTLQQWTSKKRFDKVIVTRKYGNSYDVNVVGNNIVLDEEGKKFIIDEMPQFLYFDDYYTLNASINIPTYLSDFEANEHDPKLRVINSLFSHVGLDLKTLEYYDPNKPEIKDAARNVEKRRALCDAAQEVMTEKFSKWWLQHKHVFHYNTDSSYFHISVSDELDSSPIVLEERSQGMKYFFSFYLVFLEETKDKHKNTILLLDEPGLHYHGQMQLDLIKFFKRLAEKNQLFYSTHSPFLVDSKNLDSIKTVFENKKTGFSEVADSDNWPKDNEALFPIRVGWWYDVFKSYIQDKIHLILEGQSDVELFNAINEILEQQNRTTLSSKIICIPGGGNKTSKLIKLLNVANVSIILFQDGDEAGILRSKQLHKEYRVPYCITSDFIYKNTSSIEDLFPTDFFMDMVQKTYPDYDIPRNIKDSNEMIMVFVNNLFEEKGYPKANKLKIAIKIIKNGENISPNTLDIFENIFKKINKLANNLSS